MKKILKKRSHAAVHAGQQHTDRHQASPDTVLWSDWRWQVRNRIVRLEELEKWINPNEEERKAVRYSAGRLKMAITPHFASLMDTDDPWCPIRRQAVPVPDEFKTSSHDLKDPCGEEKDTVAPGLVHRYPDRVLLLITDACAMYCRHCTRRRIVGSREGTLTMQQLKEAIHYISKNRKIRDVLISGGDPLLLSDGQLDNLLGMIREIPHVEIIRLGTRLPVTLPQRFTPELCNVLSKYHPLYISIHCNHEKEISVETQHACNRLTSAGIPLGSQTVLLKDINDDPKTMMRLMRRLLSVRIRPYYLYQCDLAPGTEHVRTSVNVGLKIIESLRGHTTGYAVPTYVIDAPGGGGKVPINPETIIARSKSGIMIRNYQGRIFFYPDTITRTDGQPSANP
ncbi:MAG: KamA family radical SAM protein [Elusimicrobia bacterium]|nr:KamA family radical SAM protein [Elusimicrobiota bacterium]MBD3412650.1 KamA family radical SAM protein [Elusimicrobiota bacterium]